MHVFEYSNIHILFLLRTVQKRFFFSCLSILKLQIRLIYDFRGMRRLLAYYW